jgi:response regulator RpfG family c-di-GMP phosphodiesterase
VRKTKVLLVDDESLLAETLQEILALNGFDASVATDGFKSLEVSREIAPDIIICDILMPRMDGFRFFQEFKEKISPNDPFILLEYLSYIELETNRIIGFLSKVTTWYDVQKRAVPTNNGANRTELSSILAQNALEIAKKYHRTNDLTLQLRFKPLINLSPELIKACFSELIDNAFKFSNTGDRVRVTLYSEEYKCIVTLEDSGSRSCAGELMDYEPFTQFRTQVFEQQGLGIGLNIAKSIAEIIRADVEFLNNKPQGIIVKVTIPLND